MSIWVILFFLLFQEQLEPKWSSEVRLTYITTPSRDLASCLWSGCVRAVPEQNLMAASPSCALGSSLFFHGFWGVLAAPAPCLLPTEGWLEFPGRAVDTAPVGANCRVAAFLHEHPNSSHSSTRLIYT